MTRARDVASAATAEIYPLDSLQTKFDGIKSIFTPTYKGSTLTVSNPFRLLITVNGILQTVDFPEYVWQSMYPRSGFQINSDGNIMFSEVPPAGSTFDGRLMTGNTTNSTTKIYPFKAVDILLGA